MAMCVRVSMMVDDDDDGVDDSDLQDNHDDDHDHAIFSLSDECKCCVSGVTL